MNIVNAIKAACAANGSGYCSWDEIVANLAVPMDEPTLKSALNDLKNAGAVTFPDRGRNARTRYEVLNGDAAEKQAEVIAEPAPAVVVEPTRTVLPLLPEARALGEGEGYGGDAYFARVAMNMTPCFGGWSHKAKTCDGCPLRHECRNAALAELQNMAARWSPNAGVSKPEPEPLKPERVLLPTVRAPFDVICAGCHEPIHSGSDMVYDPPGKASGCYHESCC